MDDGIYCQRKREEEEERRPARWAGRAMRQLFLRRLSACRRARRVFSSRRRWCSALTRSSSRTSWASRCSSSATFDASLLFDCLSTARCRCSSEVYCRMMSDTDRCGKSNQQDTSMHINYQQSKTKLKHDPWHPWFGKALTSPQTVSFLDGEVKNRHWKLADSSLLPWGSVQVTCRGKTIPAS